MRSERTEYFRKWATLIVSTVALLITSLRDPILLTLKNTVKEVVHEELEKQSGLPLSEARREKQRDAEAELLKLLNEDLAPLRDLNAKNSADRGSSKSLYDCLASIEAKLDELAKESQRNRKSESDRTKVD